MKRLLLLAILLPLFVHTWAQPRLREPEMYVGLHGGAIASMGMFTPQVAGTKALMGTVLLSGEGGFVFRYAGHKCCGFQLELNYMQRGWRENTDENAEEVAHYTRRLDYIEMPFLAHIFFGKKMCRGFFNLGPQIGYCVHESESGTKHPTQQAQYEELENKFDWGLAAGLGLLVRTPKAGVFQLEARFSYSLGDYFSNRKTDYFSRSNPITLSLNVGYLWEIKRKKQ